MDITKIQEQVEQDEEAVAIPIYQKNGDPYLAKDGTPATISVTGPDAKRYVQTKNAVSRRALNRRKARIEPSDLREVRIELAAAAVTGWHGWESGETPLDPTPDNVRGLLNIEHILDQVEAGIIGHADFLRSSRS